MRKFWTTFQHVAAGEQIESSGLLVQPWALLFQLSRLDPRQDYIMLL